MLYGGPFAAFRFAGLRGLLRTGRDLAPLSLAAIIHSLTAPVGDRAIVVALDLVAAPATVVG